MQWYKKILKKWENGPFKVVISNKTSPRNIVWLNMAKSNWKQHHVQVRAAIVADEVKCKTFMESLENEKLPKWLILRMIFFLNQQKCQKLTFFRPKMSLFRYWDVCKQSCIIFFLIWKKKKSYENISIVFIFF